MDEQGVSHSLASRHGRAAITVFLNGAVVASKPGEMAGGIC